MTHDAGFSEAFQQIWWDIGCVQSQFLVELVGKPILSCGRDKEGRGAPKDIMTGRMACTSLQQPVLLSFTSDFCGKLATGRAAMGGNKHWRRPLRGGER